MNSVFHELIPKIESMQCIKDIEQMPLSQRLKGIDNSYTLLKKAAQLYQDKIALRFIPNLDNLMEVESYSYQTLFEKVTQIANLLLDHGITGDDVVTIILPNLPQTIFALNAAETVAIANPISPILLPDEIAKLWHITHSRFLITLPEILHQLPNCQQFKHIFLLTSAATVTENHNIKPFSNYRAYPKQQLTCDEAVLTKQTCALFHTSGTTGQPKLVKLSHYGKIYSAWSFAAIAHYCKKDVILSGLPYFHVGAPTVCGNAAFAVGAEIVLAGATGWREPALIENFWQMVDQFAITSVPAVAHIYRQIVEQPITGLNISSLRHAVSGAAALLSPKVCEAFCDLTGVSIQKIYGLSEVTCTAATTLLNTDYPQSSMGVPYPYTQIKIVRRDDRQVECQINELGIVYIKGPGVTTGYMTDIADEANCLDEEGWLNSGDIAYKRDDNYFEYINRLIFMISRGAPFNVSTKTIEDLLLDIQDIRQAAVVAAPDVAEGEVPIAYVSLNATSCLNADAIQEMLMKRVSDDKLLPSVIHILDQLPVNAMGKVIKPLLIMKEQH